MRLCVTGGRGVPRPRGTIILRKRQKKRVGARPGNRNAVKTGVYSAATRARHAALKARIRAFRQLVDNVIAALEPDRG